MSRLASRRTPILALLLAGLFGLTAIWGFYTSDSAAKARERDARLAAARAQGEAPTATTPTLEVEIEVARSVPQREIVELTGVLEPIRSTWVAAELAGRIVEVPAVEHAHVEQGALLVRLEGALPEAELIRAEASHALAESELARQRRLGSRSVASEAELDQAEAEERRTFAALLEARTRVAYTRITAPFDGLVNALELDPGAYVQPGTPIAEVLDLSTLEVTVLVGDRQVSVLHPGDAVDVRVDARGNQSFSGRIVRVAGAPQDGGQRYPVVIALENPAEGQGRDLRPGMLAHVRFEVGTRQAIRLPARALLHEFELDYVFVLEKGNRARRARVSIRPVPFRPDRVEITRGLTDGDRVVVTAADQLRNGMRVLLR